MCKHFILQRMFCTGDFFFKLLKLRTKCDTSTFLRRDMNGAEPMATIMEINSQTNYDMMRIAACEIETYMYII